MNVKDIVRQWLTNNKFDGLYHENECGCKIDDLIPCEEPCNECKPGHLLPGDEEYDWYIGEQTNININPCESCGSNNIKFRGTITNCEDCGERWPSMTLQDEKSK